MSDLIDRAEAVMALRLEYPMMPFFKENRKEWAIKTEGFRKAEEVIMKLPSADAPTTMTGVIDAIREAEYRGYMKAVEERPKGEWIKHEAKSEITGLGIDFYPTEYECSCCGLKEQMYFINSKPHNYCPNCGADMRGAENGTDKDKSNQ